MDANGHLPCANESVFLENYINVLQMKVNQIKYNFRKGKY